MSQDGISEAQQIAGAAQPRSSACAWFFRFGDYRFIDCITQGYVALVAVLVLLFHNHTVPLWPMLLAAHAGCLLGVHWIIRLASTFRRSPALDLLRHFYPVLLYTAFYRETGALNQLFFSGFMDPAFIRIEQGLFGMQPSIAFMEALPWLPVSELFYASYFSYYVMIVGVGVALYFRNRRQFFHYVSLVSFVFYCCYLTYIFLPVIGARVFFQECGGAALPDYVRPEGWPVAYPPQVTLGPFYKIMLLIYDRFEAMGAAFPSSHVAVALCTLTFSWRYLPRLRAPHAVAVTLLSVSTVYCRYHYAVDVLAGAAAGALLVAAGERLYRKWGPLADAAPGPP